MKHMTAFLNVELGLSMAETSSYDDTPFRNAIEIWSGIFKDVPVYKQGGVLSDQGLPSLKTQFLWLDVDDFILYLGFL